MEELIKYYYGIKVVEFEQKREGFLFHDGYHIYMFQKNRRDISIISEIESVLINNGIPHHKIIRNVDRELETPYKGEKYILIEYIMSGKLKDIDFFIGKGNLELEKRWSENKRILELKLENNINELRHIESIINYYIGLMEIAIQMIGKFEKNNKNEIYLQFIGENKENILEVGNILNIYKCYKNKREALYIKKMIKEEYEMKEIEYELNNIIKSNINSEYEMKIFICYILYPEYMIKEINMVDDEQKFWESYEYINRLEEVIRYLRQIKM